MSDRIPLADPSRLDDDERAQFDRLPSNLTRALLLLDRRLAQTLPQVANKIRASSLPAMVREGAFLRVAVRQDSAYERFQHVDQARNVGWSDEQIDASKAAGMTGCPPDRLRCSGSWMRSSTGRPSPTTSSLRRTRCCPTSSS